MKRKVDSSNHKNSVRACIIGERELVTIFISGVDVCRNVLRNSK